MLEKTKEKINEATNWVKRNPHVVLAGVVLLLSYRNSRAAAKNIYNLGYLNGAVDLYKAVKEE